MPDLGVRLQLLIGANVPRPAPFEVMEAFVALEVRNNDRERDVFDMELTLGKDSLVDYGLLLNGYFDPPSRIVIAVLIDSKVGLFVWKAIRLQLRKRSLRIINFEKAAILRWIATVLRKSDLDLISGENSALMRRVAARCDLETHYRLVKWNSLVDTRDRQIHRVALVRPGALEH